MVGHTGPNIMYEMSCDSSLVIPRDRKWRSFILILWYTLEERKKASLVYTILSPWEGSVLPVKDFLVKLS